MRGLERHVALRERIAAAELAGPRIVTTGPHLGSPGPGFEGRRIVRTREEAIRAVLDHRTAGFDFVKIYSGLSAEVLRSSDRGGGRRAPAGGRPRPPGGGAERSSPAAIRSCSTLSTYRAIGPQAEVFQQFHTDLVRGLNAEGVPILVGTDSEGHGDGPSPLVVELRALAEAGLGRWQLLRAATRGAQELLGRDAPAGTISVGAPADLILLAADPLQDLGALEHPRLTCVAGRCVDVESR